jgi:hypothetical protein
LYLDLRHFRDIEARIESWKEMAVYLTKKWTGFFGRLKKVEKKKSTSERKLTEFKEHKASEMTESTHSDELSNDEESQLKESSDNDKTANVETHTGTKRKRQPRTKKDEIHAKNYEQDLTQMRRQNNQLERKTIGSDAQVPGVNVKFYCRKWSSGNNSIITALVQVWVPRGDHAAFKVVFTLRE